MIDRTDIVCALREAGLEPGMTVFSHSNIGFFGPVKGARNLGELVPLILSCFLEVLGNDGTLVLPVFTYSFGSDKEKRIFDPQSSLSNTSSIGDWLITNEQGLRSWDPMLSVIAIGVDAEKLTSNVGTECFGRESVWARLHDADALICNLNLDSGSTFLHWVERENQVSYRRDYVLKGAIVENFRAREADVTYFGRQLDDPDAVPSFEAFHSACVEYNVSRRVYLGRGQIVSHHARQAKMLLDYLLAREPYILTEKHRPRTFVARR